MHPSKTPIAHRPTLLLVGILLIAANLRAPFTAVPPVLAQVRADFGLSTLAAGALTTLPLLAFAILSPFSALFARRYGLERALAGALFTLLVGIALRGIDQVGFLYLGSAVIGLGIAVGNVLLPGLVKRDFPHNVAAITGAYALTMGVAAAVGSASVIPLAQAWGWRWALLAFGGLTLLTLAVWSTQLGSRSLPATVGATLRPGGAVWRSALAWQVTLFLGLNSTIYYVAIGWLPAILAQAGMPPAEAGSVHGVMQLATAVPGLVLGPIVRRLRDQRAVAVSVSVCSAIALAGLLLAPHYALFWAALFGVGTGGGIILGLSFIGLRTVNAQQAASLSGMSQCIGYLLASVGPIALGALHDVAGSWALPLVLCTVLALLGALMGLLAGKNRVIS